MINIQRPEVKGQRSDDEGQPKIHFVKIELQQLRKVLSMSSNSS